MYNMKRKKEIEQANAFAIASTGNTEPESKEILELQERYINEEIDEKEYQELGLKIALRELKAALKKGEK